MAISFRARLLFLVTGLVASSLCAVIFAIFWATEASVQRNIDREIGVSERVFLQLIEQRRVQLTQSASVLADDFGFRQAVASTDEITILSALVNHAQRIEADLVTLIAPDGRVVVSSHEIDNASALLARGQAQSNTDFGITVVENEIQQLVAVPVRAPQLLGYVVLGFVIDKELAEVLQQITNTQITFVAHDKSGDILVVSSSTDLLEAGIQQAVGDEPSLYRWLADVNLRGNWIDLLNQDAFDDAKDMQLHVLLSASIEEASQPFAPLQRQLIIFATLTLLAAIAVALLTGRQVVKPVRLLAQASQRVALGRYDQQVPYQASDELGQLADSFNQMQSAISEREIQISYQSNHDLLTDLPNRRYLGRYSKALILERRPFDLVVINLDSFKEINDMFGQTICDQLLVLLAKRMLNVSSATLWPARLHGDEFIFIIQPESKLTEIKAEAIIEKLSPPLELGGLNYTLKMSAGLVSFPDAGENLDDLLRRAQFARIKARAENKTLGIYKFGEDEPHMRKLAVSAALASAIRKEELSLMYQPQVCRKTKAAYGAEALIRWHHPGLGFISPVEFIPLAEQSGDIHEITQWVITESIAQLATWRESHANLRMSINLSATDLTKQWLSNFILSQLTEYEVAPQALTVEVTESAVMADPIVAVKLLETLRAQGVAVAVDDYGTGYSSLAQLRNLPADELKIDRTFVMDLDDNQQDQTIVASTIELAHKLGMHVVAEGVETTSVWSALADRHCDILQGYFISKPLTANDFQSWIDRFDYNKLCPE